jgi:uncharacterized protein with FMN-binding domain
VATVAAIVLLASFRTPDQAPPRIAAVPRGTLSTPAPSAPPTAQASAPPASTAPSPTAPPAGTAPAATTGPTATVVPTIPRPTVRPAPQPTPRPQPTPTPVAASGLHDGTWTGADEFAGNYGDVQVRLVIRGGRIADVQALVMPTDRRRSAQISQYAGPQLHDEVLQAQSATIDTVSGATYTSDAYAQSVQAALDQARA